MATNYYASYYDPDHGHWHTGGEHETLDAARAAVRHADVWSIVNDDDVIIDSSIEESARSIASNPTDQRWYDDYANVVTFANHLVYDDGDDQITSAEELLRVLEKPERWTAEWEKFAAENNISPA